MTEKREPPSRHLVQRAQRDAEAGRGESPRSAGPGGGDAAGGGEAGPRRVGGLGPRAPFHGAAEWGRSISLRRALALSLPSRGAGRARATGVGRPTTPPGACLESARMLHRARLITSRGVPRWFTAADFSADERTALNSFLRGAAAIPGGLTGSDSAAVSGLDRLDDYVKPRRGLGPRNAPLLMIMDHYRCTDYETCWYGFIEPCRSPWTIRVEAFGLGRRGEKIGPRVILH